LRSLTPLNHIRSGRHISDIGMQRVREASDRSRRLVIDTACNTPMDVLAQGTKIRMKDTLGLIVVDYLQLMSPPVGRKYGSRQEEVQEISRTLKKTARDLDVPMLLVTQLNADGDTRESRSIEHDATAVIRLGRVGPDSSVCLVVPKNRYGPTVPEERGIVCRFEGHYMRFRPLADAGGRG